MPSVQLWGRRWHFSTDIVAVPALMSAFFHVAWIVILLTWAGVTGAWPGRCSSSGGVQYLVLGGGLLGSFAVNLAVDVLLVYHSLQGAPFEASKRRWVVPLLYTATGPLVCTLGFTVFGTHVCTHLEPDCWPIDQRNAVTNLAQALVFSTWGFLAIAVIGIAVTYNMYPQHHDLSSWEARCKCLAAMLCCKANITRRPDGKRAPLTNIAELTAGLLSHCDLDATDITVGLFLAAAAQKRRRRLRVAKALLPVYRALRSTAGSSAADERSQTEDEDHGSEEDAGSTASSINDVPADRELDHMIAAQQRLSHERQQEDSTVLDRASTLQGPGDAGGRQPVRIPQRQAKAVSWARELSELATTRPGKDTEADRMDPDLGGISLPQPAQWQVQHQQYHTAGRETTFQAVAESAGSLPLTEGNVAVLDRRLALMEEGSHQHTEQGAIRSAAELVAGDLLADLPAGLPDQHAEILDRLAGAIEEEIVQAEGGGQQASSEAVLVKEESLDLSALQVDPDAPSIWFSTASSRQVGTLDGMSSRGSRLSGQGKAGGTQRGEQAAAGTLAAQSPFYSAGGGSRDSSDSAAASEVVAEPADGVMQGLAVEAATAVVTGGEGHRLAPDSCMPPTAAADAIPPPADAAAAAAVAEVSAATAGSRAISPSSEVTTSILQKQITLRFPVVITPSEHVEDFRGVLSPTILADIYAGRHTKVPSSVLKEAIYCLKYSYAVYSLQPKIEAPSSGLDVASCACCGRPTDPQQVVLNAMRELEELEEEGSVEILMVNCSNRVLAHLPYMVVADHGRRAVVLAIRGTISIADLVTDAVVYPEPLDSFLPQEIKEELSEPAFAHAGMVAAAKAIFEDMLQRDILPQLVRDEAMADFTAPEQQEARRDGLAHPQRASQYDADAGSCAPGAEQYMITGHSVSGGDGGSNGPVRRERAGPSGDALEQSQQQDQQPGVQGRQRLQGAGSEQSPGRQVGEIMRHLIEDEGWQFIVEGHSLGAGAAALISLKLLETYPGLKCLAYSCPGLVSKNLAHAMSRFCTTVVCGKDAVPRSTVANLARLMDEVVTALARCRQPKLQVLLSMFFPRWRMHKARLSELFHSYQTIPDEPREVLHRYYESRARIGQPLSMYPPGRLLFLRPIKTRQHKEFDAVWITPQDLVAEGLLISPNMLRDHLCSQVYESLTAAAAHAEQLESGAGSPELVDEVGAHRRATAAPASPDKQPKRPARVRRQQGLQAGRAGSLQQVLIEAS